MAYYNDGNYSNKTLDGSCQHLEMYTNKAFREYVPFHSYDYTYLKITNDHHDVNLINKNFMNVTTQVKIVPKTDITFETRTYKWGKTMADIEADKANNYRNVYQGGAATPGAGGVGLYVGWKNSSEVIEEMTVYNNNRETGFQQIHADRENYLESTKFKTATEKDLYRDCHFTYENYKNKYEGELPGILISDTKAVSPIVITNQVKATIMTQPQDLQLYPLTPAFDTLISGTGVHNWHVVDKSLFNEVMDRSARGEGGYKEWEDFCYNYDYALTAGTNKFQDSNKVQYDTLQLLAAEIKKDATLLPLLTTPATPYSQTFIREQKHIWRTNDPYVAEIPLIIPLKDLPAFNSMDIFEKPFGDITLKLMLGYRSLMIIVNTQKCRQYCDGDYELSDFIITNLTCECWGYNVGGQDGTSDTVWASLRNRYENSDRGRIYEARFTDFKNFDGNMQTGRFNIEFPYSLEMVKYIHMVFPTKTFHTTVFRNPNLKDIKLKLDGVLYPREETLRTDNKLFYHLQINDYEFDDDVKYSYTCPVLNEAKDDIRADNDKNANLDDSNFIITWPLAIGPFMAVHRYSDNININFTAEIIAYVKHMYGVDDTAADYNNYVPSPQIWFTHDSCWRLTLKDGLQFLRNVCPSYDLYQGNGDDVFYMHA